MLIYSLFLRNLSEDQTVLCVSLTEGEHPLFWLERVSKCSGSTRLGNVLCDDGGIDGGT